MKRLHALAEPPAAAGRAQDCVEAHEAGWAVVNLMEDGPPTVGVALFGASPAERGGDDADGVRDARREKRRADAIVATRSARKKRHVTRRRRDDGGGRQRPRRRRR